MQVTQSENIILKLQDCELHKYLVLCLCVLHIHWSINKLQKYSSNTKQRLHYKFLNPTSRSPPTRIPKQWVSVYNNCLWQHSPYIQLIDVLQTDSCNTSLKPYDHRSWNLQHKLEPSQEQFPVEDHRVTVDWKLKDHNTQGLSNTHEVNMSNQY